MIRAPVGDKGSGNDLQRTVLLSRRIGAKTVLIILFQKEPAVPVIEFHLSGALDFAGNISVPDPAGLPVNPDRRIPSLLRLHKRGQTVILKMSKLRGADTQAVLSIRFDA